MKARNCLFFRIMVHILFTKPSFYDLETSHKQNVHRKRNKKAYLCSTFYFPLDSEFSCKHRAFDSALKIYLVNNGFLVQQCRPDPFLLLQLLVQLGL